MRCTVKPGSFCAGTLTALLLLAGCAGGAGDAGNAGSYEQAAQEAPPAEAAPEPSGEAYDNAALEAMLVRADELDGAVDQVVSKCGGCALRMDGSPDHVLQTHGYELRFCSDTCRGHFAEGTEQALLALQLPGE